MIRATRHRDAGHGGMGEAARQVTGEGLRVRVRIEFQTYIVRVARWISIGLTVSETLRSSASKF